MSLYRKMLFAKAWSGLLLLFLFTSDIPYPYPEGSRSGGLLALRIMSNYCFLCKYNAAVPFLNYH